MLTAITTLQQISGIKSITHEKTVLYIQYSEICKFA